MDPHGPRSFRNEKTRKYPKGTIPTGVAEYLIVNKPAKKKTRPDTRPYPVAAKNPARLRDTRPYPVVRAPAKGTAPGASVQSRVKVAPEKSAGVKPQPAANRKMKVRTCIALCVFASSCIFLFVLTRYSPDSQHPAATADELQAKADELQEKLNAATLKSVADRQQLNTELSAALAELEALKEKQRILREAAAGEDDTITFTEADAHVVRKRWVKSRSPARANEDVEVPADAETTIVSEDAADKPQDTDDSAEEPATVPLVAATANSVSPGSSDDLARQAKSAYAAGQLATAAEKCRESLSGDAGNSTARTVCALTACKQRQPDAANKHMRGLSNARQALVRKTCLANEIEPS